MNARDGRRGWDIVGGCRVKERMANARIKANRARDDGGCCCCYCARNKFRRKEMRTVKYSRGMRKSRNDNAGCQPRTAVRLRAEHLSDENGGRGAARCRIKRDHQRRVEIRTYGARSEGKILLRALSYSIQFVAIRWKNTGHSRSQIRRKIVKIVMNGQCVSIFQI